ncbi:MAG TPA: TetR/AcrR family transcriptional regulator [Gammaproteobacteria bacterium]|jgi:TetR/AcrR family transcriptional repressor of nem operon|nr:TetR/AcrR family transcriptional regulator [Gammaproteobacteria bacterium]
MRLISLSFNPAALAKVGHDLMARRTFLFWYDTLNGKQLTFYLPIGRIATMNKNTVYDNILDIAETLIQTQGYNAFSFRHIAQATGIKTSSIHYYFPTKADLGKAVVTRHIEVLHAELVHVLENKKISCKKKIHLFLESIFAKTYAANRKMCLGGMLASDVLTLPEPILFEVRVFFKRIEKWLEQVLVQGRAKEDFHFSGTAKKEAEFILALLEGSLLLARLFQDEEKLQMAKKQIEERLF